MRQLAWGGWEGSIYMLPATLKPYKRRGSEKALVARHLFFQTISWLVVNTASLPNLQTGGVASRVDMDTIYRWISDYIFCCGLPSLKFASQEKMIRSELPVSDHVSSSAVKCTEKLLNFSEGRLFPGIPDVVTLSHIVIKLPWTAFGVLSSVSLSWRQAIQSRQIYDERVHFKSTETFIVFKHLDSSLVNAISLYSMKVNAFYKLPPISCDLSWREISQNSEFVSVSGKLYVLGAYQNQDIYVLDLAGQKKWEKCATIQEPAGRQYSLGTGCANWYGDSLSVQGGEVDWFESSSHQYHSAEGEWRTLTEPLRRLALDTDTRQNFVIEGKHYCIKKHGRTHNIYIRDTSHDEICWRHQHSISCEELGSDIGSIEIILPVNDELLAIASWNREVGSEHCLVQSRGFGKEKREIVWQKARDSLHFDESPHQSLFTFSRITLLPPFAMCPIQL